MSAAVPSGSLRVISAKPDGAVRRVHLLMRQREALRPLFRTAWDDLAARFDADELEGWAAGVLALADVNAGPSCLVAFWEGSRNQPTEEGIASLIVAAHTAANICRNAGARAAAATLVAVAIARRFLGTGASLARWWRIMDDLASQAPESVEAAAARMGEILSAGDINTFESFVAAGLKLAAGDGRKRLKFFTLQDELARRLVERATAGIGFAETERQTKAFVTSLWGRPPLLRSFAGDTGQTPQRRAGIAGPLIRLPEIYRGVQGEAAYALYRAAAAHAQAHLVFGGARFPVAKLKPLQVALVTLIEDARIELLAMRQLPGLRKLWSPYHVAMPAGVATAPTLLARLARALFDPTYEDDDSFVAKGRAMFDAALPRLQDPAISREVGMLLGNDLGQMRIQFNAKTYVVEPVYRDDGLGLWDFGEDAPSSGEPLDLAVDAVRLEQQEKPDQELRPDLREDEDKGSAGRARPVAADQRGVVIAKYPEWDRAHGVERPEWTTVREIPARPGNPRLVEEALDRADVLRNRIRRLVRGVRVGRTIRLKRQLDGHDLDLDAVIDTGIALRLGQEPDPRVFRSTTSKHRDLAVLLLLDISESTRDRLASGVSILEVERLAVAVLAEAMSALGDPFSMLAFASNGRDDVEMTTVKAFDEPYDRACVGRLAALSSGLSTRLGTALRHAGELISHARSFRKLVIVLTDGEPSDVDVADPLDLVEDARRAAVGLRARGIDGFGVVLGSHAMNSAVRIFGRGNTMLVPRVEDLPARLSELYFRLARR
ncbi:VWA domain-containing protein [Bradyrhizobium sp.]|uniref:nitric oxide reductase activation protein NorD n=1 Tax=Bradyrhizobium sp. TaxID=376 RepID=UPI0025B891BD|nr:VWA domain-containing protein [Bradyrhizobium sp.]